MIMIDEAAGSIDPKDILRMDTISDANMACKTAVDILNDLLCFDMLESGILLLHCQEIGIISFLNDNIKLFASQAKESGVELILSLDNGDMNMSVSAIAAALMADSWIVG